MFSKFIQKYNIINNQDSQTDCQINREYSNNWRGLARIDPSKCSLALDFVYHIKSLLFRFFRT